MLFGSECSKGIHSYRKDKGGKDSGPPHVHNSDSTPKMAKGVNLLRQHFGKNCCTNLGIIPTLREMTLVCRGPPNGSFHGIGSL